MYVKSAPSLISIISIAILALSGAAAYGQGSSSAQAPASNQAQASGQPQPSGSAYEHETDIGGSFYYAMNSATTAKGVTQTPTDAYGGMFEIRHIQNPLVGYELTYGYHSNKETIAPVPAPNCGLYCNSPVQDLSVNTSLVGLDWVFSKKFGNLRPFATGGLGFLIFEPNAPRIATSATTTVPGYGINDTVRIAWLYGGGVDYSITDHLGVRAQIRGEAYKVPNLSMLFPAQGVYTQTFEPMGGVFYRF